MAAWFKVNGNHYNLDTAISVTWHEEEVETDEPLANPNIDGYRRRKVRVLVVRWSESDFLKLSEMASADFEKFLEGGAQVRTFESFRKRRQG